MNRLFTSPDNRPLLKVCGLTRPEDVALCLALGVDALGFIFAPDSSRRLGPGDAAALSSGGAARVGVFAGHGPEAVLAAMDAAKLDYAQLHGGENAAFCRAVGPDRVIKVLWPERLLAAEGLKPETASPQRMADILHAACEPFADSCAGFLLDAGLRGGGSGRSLPPDKLRLFRPPRPWLLAGGLGPDNAATALRACSASGLDCCSGVESAPGRKDACRLAALVNSLRPVA